MTKTERHIKAAALKAISRYGEPVGEFNTELVIIPFLCDGVFDELIYNTKKKKFVEIRYYKCVGKIITTPFSAPKTGWGDEIKTVIIPL